MFNWYKQGTPLERNTTVNLTAISIHRLDGGEEK
jgi:hypothetical protein